MRPGFSIFAGEAVSSELRLERVARWIARPALAIDSLRRREDGSLEIQTSPDPSSGATVRTFDPLEWIYAVTAHIPDRGQHQVRYYGAFANRTRSSLGLLRADLRGTMAPALSVTVPISVLASPTQSR